MIQECLNAVSHQETVSRQAEFRSQAEVRIQDEEMNKESALS